MNLGKFVCSTTIFLTASFASVCSMADSGVYVGGGIGSPDGSVGGVPVSYKAHGIDYAVLAGLGLGPVDLMARLGGLNYKLEKNVGGVHNDYDGNAPVYGIGLWFTLFGVGVRAEYEKIDIKELDDAQMVSVSAFFKF